MFKFYLKVLNKNRLIKNSISIKFNKNRIKIFKIKSPIIDFFLLLLRVLFNITLYNIHKNLWVIETFLKKSLKFNLK